MKTPALEPFPVKVESVNGELHGLKRFITTARTSRKHLRHVTKAKGTDWTDLPMMTQIEWSEYYLNLGHSDESR